MSFAQSPLGPHLSEGEVCRIWSNTMDVSPPATSYSELARILDVPLSAFEFYPAPGYVSFDADDVIFGSYSAGTYLFKPNILLLTNLASDVSLSASFRFYDSYNLEDLGYFDALSVYVNGVESSHLDAPWLALDPLLRDSTSYFLVSSDGAMVELDFSSYYNLSGTASNIVFTNNSIFVPVAPSSANISHSWDFSPAGFNNTCYRIAEGPFWYHHDANEGGDFWPGYVTEQDLINAGVLVDSVHLGAIFASPPASNNTVNSSTVNVSLEFSDSSNLRAAFGWSD